MLARYQRTSAERPVRWLAMKGGARSRALVDVFYPPWVEPPITATESMCKFCIIKFILCTVHVHKLHNSVIKNEFAVTGVREREASPSIYGSIDDL